MKNVVVIILIFCTINAFGRQPLIENQKLESLAKVWGFLKYYHPNVAKGKFDWDAELFKVLPQVKQASTKEELSQVYINWIDTLGKVKACKKCHQSSSTANFNKNFDLSWIDDTQAFNAELSEKLRSIERNRHQGKKYYVSSSKFIGNIKVTNEINYKGFDWNNENLRLLSLFRYWNIIEYFFPYKYQTDTNWDKVLHNMLPKFLNPETELDYNLAMLELVASIDDSHAGFYNEKVSTYFGHYWIPAHFKLIDEKAIITGFYDDSLATVADLKIGDVITKVDDKPVETIFQEKAKYISGSNLPRKRHNAFYSILNGPSDSVKIEFIRNNHIATKTIKRYLKDNFHSRPKVAEKFKIFDGNIGYANMGVIEPKDVTEIMAALENTKAIIFDIRNYPKGTMYALVNYISSKKNDFYKVTYPDLNYPGKFI